MMDLEDMGDTMKILAYDWWCPLCGRQGAYIGGAKPSDVYWERAGGGTAVCTKCAKERKEEIDVHNEIYIGSHKKKKDPNCDHSWTHPYPARFYCIRCGATYNFLCGCGGSAYVCSKHHEEFVRNAVKEEGSLENYLSKNSW